MTIAFPMLITGCNKPPETTGTQTSAAIESHTGPTSVNDSEVTSRVKSALAQDDILKMFEITVATLKGDVRITGVVDNQAQIDHADKLLHSIEGVHTIHDELTIKK
jgi:osmotically-inducible protein OsmY